ncbi:hypothetical protein C8R43DRAFT_1122322 [Mycena crocata]|nr:hypothetical protein C8R43DRAFT_1122322 [Mycena crocata]
MPSPLMLSSTPTRLGTFNIDSVDYEVVVIAAHSPPLPTTTSTIPQLSRPLRNILFNTNVASISALCSIPCFKLVLVSSKHSNPAADIDCSFKFDRRVDTSTSNFKSLLQISALPFKVDSLRRQIRFKSQLVLAFNFRCCASKLILCRKSHSIPASHNAKSAHFVDSVTPYRCLRSTSSLWMFGLLSLRTGTRSYLEDFNLIHFQVSPMNYLQICLRTHSSQECPSRFKPSMPTIQVWFKFRLKDVERGKGIMEGHTTQVLPSFDRALPGPQNSLHYSILSHAFAPSPCIGVQPWKMVQLSRLEDCIMVAWDPSYTSASSLTHNAETWDTAFRFNARWMVHVHSALLRFRSQSIDIGFESSLNHGPSVLTTRSQLTKVETMLQSVPSVPCNHCTSHPPSMIELLYLHDHIYTPYCSEFSSTLGSSLRWFDSFSKQDRVAVPTPNNVIQSTKYRNGANSQSGLTTLPPADSPYPTLPALSASNSRANLGARSHRTFLQATTVTSGTRKPPPCDSDSDSDLSLRPVPDARKRYMDEMPRLTLTYLFRYCGRSRTTVARGDVTAPCNAAQRRRRGSEFKGPACLCEFNEDRRAGGANVHRNEIRDVSESSNATHTWITRRRRMVRGCRVRRRVKPSVQRARPGLLRWVWAG